jgi:hypothetical protein
MAYDVSKAALKALAESLSHDLVKGVRVTAHLLIPASAPPVITATQPFSNGGMACRRPGAALDEAKAALAAAGIAVTALPTDMTPRD